MFYSKFWKKTQKSKQFFIQFMAIDKKNKNDKFKISIFGCKDFLKKEWIFYFLNLTFWMSESKKEWVT
jgi:hypothetical protein